LNNYSEIKSAMEGLKETYKTGTIISVMQDKNNFIIVIDYTNCKKNFCKTHKNIGKKAEK
jgi:hypothetical protein